MKRFLTFIALSVCAIASAQNVDDVIRYTTEDLQGTARYQAMGGAFGALGGDLSALNINPAGSAVFNNSLFTFTGTYFDRNSDAGYGGTFTNTNSNNLDINQVGGALVFNSSDPDSNWKKISVAFNYDVAQNFDDRKFISGTGNQGIDTYFLDAADGIRLGNLEVREGETVTDAYIDIGATEGLGFGAQQAFLGYQAGIIDPDFGGRENLSDEEIADNTAYEPSTMYDNVSQEFRQRINGQNSKFTVNGATQFQDILYLGASLNFHNILYDRLDRYDETLTDQNSEVRTVAFDNLLRTEGSGFSFSLGAIAKPIDFLRLGASYQSPTWYRLTDNFSQDIGSNYPNAGTSIVDIDFQGVNIFEYQIKSPGKLTGSIAAVFGKNGLLSFDYDYQDYSNSELRPTSDSFFASENQFISEALGGVSSFRVGGEYRIQRVSLRAGYRYRQSPYADGNIVGDLFGVSGGIGYNFGGSRLDFSVNRTDQDVSQYFFSGINTPAVLNRINTNFSLGYTMNF
ncbi:MAG: outer membrane protein transport protein [Pricia sp.]